MKANPQKIRILKIFDEVFEDPHYCLNYDNNPKKFKNLICEN